MVEAPGAGEPTTPRVRVLGELVVDGVAERDLGSRKGRLVLKLLALARGAPVGSGTLAEALWGDDPPSNPAEQVGVLVSRLRRALGADHVVRSDAGYALRGAWIDLDELHDRVASAASAARAGQIGSARTAAEAALALVRGPVLPDEDLDAVVGARADVDGLVSRAHHIVAEAAEAAGDPQAAAAAADAALRHDPYDEHALRTLMRAHAAAGRVASALAAYVRVRERLVEDLGIGPSEETEALHDQLVVGGERSAAGSAWPPPRTELVDRDAELAALEAALSDVEAHPAGRLVLVTGEAGIGKSALASAWSRGVAGRAVVLRGRCDELGRDLPLQPVADAVSDHLHGLDQADAAACLGADAAVVADLLGTAGVDGPPPAAFGDTEAGRARLYGALLAVIERIGAGRPVVLVVDDLHLAGASTLGWLRFAHRRGRHLLLVVTSRTGGPELPGADVVALGPLDDAAAEALVGSAGGRLDEIRARAGGNPLHLLALASASPGELPDSIRDAARRQAEALGPAAEVVSAAAVLGGDIDLDLVADVLERGAGEVLDDLERAVSVGLLDDRDSGLTFRHELVRTALADVARPERRRFLHRRAARALAVRGADPLAVAVHARLGGEVDLAIDAYVGAAASAMARYDTETVASHLDAAIGLGGSAAAFAARARLRMVTLQLDLAAADAAEAVERGGGAAAHEVAGWVAYYRRRYDEARAFAEAGVREAGDDAALRASCRAVAGRVRHGAGDLDGAEQWLGDAHDAPPAVQGVLDVWRAQVQVHRGEPVPALASLEQPLVAPDHLAHPWAGLHGRFIAVMALGQLGRVEAALQRCDQLDAAVTRAGPVGVRFDGPAANVRAWLLRHTGSPEAADERNQAVVELTSDADGRPSADSLSEYHYVALLDLADGRLLAGDAPGAAALAERLAPVDAWDGTMAWHQRHRLGLLRARLALLDGDRDGAIGHAATVVDDAAARGARRYELLGAAWLALAGGDGDRARIQEVVDGLATVAALEGWRLVAALGRAFDVAAWGAEAGRRVVALLATAGRQADPLRSMLATELD